jgi:hypothetical protein
MYLISVDIKKHDLVTVEDTWNVSYQCRYQEA